jgi:hypothetical protein
MKTRKILTAGLLIAGLAFSSVRAGNADAAPPPTAKSPTAYATQLAPYKAALAQFQTLQAAYLAKVSPIAETRKPTLDNTDADFLAAIAKATTIAQKTLALNARANATSAATTAYKTAVAAVGNAPVKPAKPAELTKPPLPVKPAAPTKPVPPVKPGNTKK